MNYQLIEKVIKCNSEENPTFTYENPVLDKKVAGLLTRSLLKVLKVSSQNSNANNNLRLSVLENIRRLCNVESENHLKVDENLTELLIETYELNLKNSSKNTADETNKLLEAFLLRKLNCTDIDLCTKTYINPEIVQALNNLNENGTHLRSISENLIYWNDKSTKSLNVLKDMWYSNSLIDHSIPESTIDDISLKMKKEIERILLEKCHQCLQNKNVNLETIIISDGSMMHLVKKAAISPHCFQICSSILNFLFINSNFSEQILNFISTFLSYIRIHCHSITISNLYPNHLKNLVILLDIDFKDISFPAKSVYIRSTLPYLKNLHKKCEDDLVLMLSHFPDWFEIYFETVDE